MIEEDIPDIVETLRECAEDSRKMEGDYYADQFATDASVFDDAAGAIEKLRDDIARLRLTDAERKALTEASEFYIGTRTGVALSDLLARLSPPAT